MMTRTIKLSDDTYSRLKNLKLVPEEHFDSVVKRLLDYHYGKVDEFELPKNFLKEHGCIVEE